MAKQSAGYLGGFSGRLGPAVGYMWNGKWCLRAHNPMVRNPRTEAQVEHRALFKQQVQLAARMRWAVTTTLTGLAREAGMTSYNLFVHLNQPAFGSADGQLQVDYASLRLSVGDVAPVELREMVWDDDNVLSVKFRSAQGSQLDYVYLYVYVPERGEGCLSAPVYRSDKRIALALPTFFAGCEAHVYLMAMSRDGRWSDSLYAGSVTEGAEQTEPHVVVAGAGTAPATGDSPAPQDRQSVAQAKSTAPPTEDIDGNNNVSFINTVT